MFISVRRYEMGAGSVGDLARKVESEFVPMVRELPGFIAYHVIDAGYGAVASVNVFEDRAGAAESNRRAASWVPEALAEFELSPVQITEGEVIVSTA